ncbi:hypothetical protein [Butyrivibrio sp. AE3004]|uniref:hypothetical protein n=1 Tax=Butyrivibrio sp. AE3004 TaxID=1506994 RepID=UPI000494D8E2|nr:hypothetical protein [Butyrivibrio sp. AE3004]
MADLSVSMISGGVERIQISPDTSAKATDKLKEQNENDSSRKEKIKEVFKDVVAVSKDGDTAQASRIAKDKLKENKDLGEVRELAPEKKAPEKKVSDDSSAAKKLFDEMKKSQENKPSAAEKMMENIKAAESKKEKKVTSSKENSFNKLAEKKEKDNLKLDTYTDSQLRELYIEGNISRYAYDHEKGLRDLYENDKNSVSNDEKVFQEGIVRAMKKENREELSDENIDRAFDEDANQNLQAEQRMAIINAAELS